MKIKIKITGGKVHGVGYRPWLTDVAVNACLHGFYAGNRTEKENSVVIVLAEVDSIETEEYTGAVMLLESYAAINTTVLLNKAIRLLSG